MISVQDCVDYTTDEVDGDGSLSGLAMPETTPTHGPGAVNSTSCAQEISGSNGNVATASGYVRDSILNSVSDTATPTQITPAGSFSSGLMEHRGMYRENSSDSRSYGDGDSARIEPDDDVLEGGIHPLGGSGSKAPENYITRLARQWHNPESCSSYSSLNNDSLSLHSPDANSGGMGSGLCAGSGGVTGARSGLDSVSPFDFRSSGIASGGPIAGSGCPGSIGRAFNFPRKYSLTVPGEPRHFRTLHRRESGSRSPLNSSCGGLSHSELSTPSPSISNSM